MHEWCRLLDNGMALSGELVRLIREPTNPYDRNAIRVDNSGGTQVGHVPKEVAAVLAPLVDRDLLRLEGW